MENGCHCDWTVAAISIVIICSGPSSFKKQLSYPWFALIVAALVVLYASYSVPAHITEISDIQNQVDRLVQE